MGGVVLFFGGNGHVAARLEAARGALARRAGGPVLADVPYPGFEGRPPAGTLDGFLDAIDASCRAETRPVAGAYATGIGALIALELRARGGLPHPLIVQGPVLWGLERRLFPRLLRWRLARDLLPQAFALPWFQDRVMRRLFLRPQDKAARAWFFEGYARCASFGDLFLWFTPGELRALERRLAGRPDALARITVWLGGRDRVVGRREVEWTEAALEVRWPRVEFPDWGHYPMIDDPEEWADALRDALAAP